MKAKITDNLDIYSFKKFRIESLIIESDVLFKNPLKDPAVRSHPILVPKGIAPKKGWPVTFVLAGLTGSGPKAFGWKPWDENMPQGIDAAAVKGEAPLGVYVFVDAFTFWGGAQYINSAGCGRYEDYLMKEIVPAVKSNYEVSEDPSRWCVTGSSSGGYGALHLGSTHPDVFGIVGALAPDSDFGRSLIPEFYKAATTLEQIGISGVKQELEEGRLFRRRVGHDLLNIVAMAHCYSGKKNPTLKDLPVDLKTGLTNSKVFKKWSEHDPVVFLPKRVAKLKKLKRIYLDVGFHDQFHLHFGARQMAKFLKSKRLPVRYTEFNGNHFDMAPRRIELWKNLEKEWKTQRAR